MTVLHSGSTKKFAEGWQAIFSKSSGKKSAAGKKAAAPAKGKKKAASAKRKPAARKKAGRS